MSKKVAILSVTDIRHITMVQIYTDYFDARQIPYEIICAERYGENSVQYPKAPKHLYHIAGLEANKIRKAIDYFRFKQFAIKILRQNQYAYVVVWNETTMVLFSEFLSQYGKYCANIRDIQPRKMMLLGNKFKACIQNSDFTTWCAQHGTEYLPKHDYVIILNQNKHLVNGARVEQKLVGAQEKIHIGVIGYIRHINESKRILRAFYNDERYILQFFGTGSEKLQRYANEIGMENVEFEGAFLPERTAELLDRMDVVNAYVGDGKEHIEQSLGSPIRFGYATLLYKPSIVSPNTFLSQRAGKLGIAYTVDSFDGLADKFHKWYRSLNFEAFKSGCDEYNRDFDDSIRGLHELCDERIYPLIMGRKYG